MGARKQKRGTPFELAVAAVQSLLDPAAVVTHNEHLIDRVGHSRQFDVVVRGRLGGHQILGVIECKDWSRRVGTPEVNAFADKANNVRANLKLIASRRGFTRSALELAAHHGIGTISLLQNAPNSEGVAIGLPNYATIYEWVRYRIIFPSALPPGVRAAEASGMLWLSQPITEWAIYAMRQFDQLRDSGTFQIAVSFTEPQIFRYAEVDVPLSVFVVEAEREFKRKVKTVNWYGKGFYEWSQQKVIYPGSTEYVSEWYRSDLSDWEDFSGEIPPLVEGNPFDVRVEIFRAPSLPSPPASLSDFARVEITKMGTPPDSA